jgi:flagellar protein FliS
MYNRNKNFANAYQKQSVMTATPAELTLMLYNACIKDIRIGREYIYQKKLDKANTSLKKAQQIIRELSSTLDPSYPVSEDILKLYDFILRNLIQGNIKKDLQMLEDAHTLVVDFRDAWFQAMKLSTEGDMKSAI